MSSLLSLKLGYNKIGDQGALMLAQTTMIKELDLSSNKAISEETKNRLKEK